MSDYLILASWWTAYCAVHSWLISLSVTNWMKRALGDRFRFWRLLYNSFSIATLVPLILYTHSAPFQSEAIFAWSGAWRLLRYGLFGLGVILAVAGARHYSMLQFLGIQQLRKARAHTAMTASGVFDDRGVLGLTRHPWYVAVFLFLRTGNLNASAITVNLVLTAYLIVGTLLEERKLILEFGDEYRSYQRRVSMFIPLKWLLQSANPTR